LHSLLPSVSLRSKLPPWRYSSASCTPSGSLSGWMMLSSSLAGLFTMVETGNVAEGGVDPLERRPLGRPLAAAGDDRGMLQPGLGRGGPAAQPIGDQPAGRSQLLGHELPDLLGPKTDSIAVVV
jgi:hypothetical protein